MDLFTFTQKILNEKFRFLCSESRIMTIQHPRRCKPSRKQIFNIFMFLKKYFRAYFPLMCLRKISIEITIFEINENVALTFSRKVFFAKSLHKHWSFSIKDFFSKCDQIRRKLRIWSHLLKKSVRENFHFLYIPIDQSPSNALIFLHATYSCLRECYEGLIQSILVILQWST